jgi:predicted O-methyltransferase YrrM
MPSRKSPVAVRPRPVPPQPLVERAIEAGRDGAAGGYVRLVRGARQLALASGALDMLDRRRDRRVPLFLRSLFAVHDIEDLGRLDVPWWTFGAIERVDAFLRSRGGRARAFEYGAGASTLWLSRRCARVVTVEHDREWWPPLAAHLKSLANVEARCIPPVLSQTPECPSRRAGWSGLDFAPYVRAIRQARGPFDLIVIDGRARSSCLREALGHLARGGLVVFDNADRRRYAPAIARSGLAVERFGGLAPAMLWPSHTALLAREEEKRAAA